MYKKATVIGFALSAVLVAGAAKKPNVIYILADDLGYGDLSCYGQEKLKTPNIDRLATEGVRFTDHYSGNTVCSPSRAVLMTGQHPGHVHCRGNVGDEAMIALDPAMVTMPRLFKNAGYATGAFGKWGLGVTSESDNQNPLVHGFDRFTGWKSQMIAHTYYPSSLVRDGNEVPLEKGTFVHDVIMNDAFAFIKDSVAEGKPFFAYIPTAVPHAAMHAPKEMHEKWRKVFPEFDTKLGKYRAGKGEICPPVVNPIAGFAAMMENLDNQIGLLLHMLKELGIDENTVIMFSSDNGAHKEGGHDPKFWDSNGPLQGHKRDLYEGGIRTPFMVRWPSVITPGRVSNHISAFWDILPTMAEITDQPIPMQNDGISLLPELIDEVPQRQHDYLYWEFCRGRKQQLTKRAARKGRWKIVKYLKNDRWSTELYNLEEDIDESENIASKYPEIVNEMEKIMDQAHRPLDEKYKGGSTSGH